MIVSRSIYSKTVINEKFINDRVKRFLREQKFLSRYIQIQFKFNVENGRKWRTIAKRTIIDRENKKDINNYVIKLQNQFNTLNDWYHTIIPEQIAFEWIDVNEQAYNRYINKQIKYSKSLPIKIDRIKGFNKIPFNTSYLEWGNDISRIDANTVSIKDVIIDSNITNIIVKTINAFTKLIFVYYDYNHSISFTDFTRSGKYYTRRTLSDGRILYFDSQQAPYFYYEDCQSTDLMHKVKAENNYHFSACTLDLETYLDDKIHKLLCAVFYDGTQSHKFYISDYNNQELLLQSLLDTILQPKYNKQSIYIHNGSSFDLVF